MVLTILAVWLWFAAREIYGAIKTRNAKGLLGLVAGTFLAIGAIGFFGAALASMTDWLPNSFEWPIGEAKGAVTTDDHYHVVPHTPAGRIQVYNNKWIFIRGWHVDASSGTFKLYISETNRINVITARRQMHYVYNIDGKLLSAVNYPVTGYSSFPNTGEICRVPTPIWLWVFTGPFYSWLVAIAGFGLLFAKNKIFPPGKQ